jgi:hypothetical protein
LRPAESRRNARRHHDLYREKCSASCLDICPRACVSFRCQTCFLDRVSPISSSRERDIERECVCVLHRFAYEQMRETGEEGREISAIIRGDI